VDNSKTEDKYSLDRFLSAQEDSYDTALSELANGYKRSHWMWYIFPQFEGLGHSSTAVYYSIKSIEEAKSYLNHPIMGARLIKCTETVVNLSGKSLNNIFGYPDNLKFCSSMTLFEYVSPKVSIFSQAIEQCCSGKREIHTLNLIEL